MQITKSNSNSAGRPAAKANTPTAAKNGHASAASLPTREQIAGLAYQLYVESGWQQGRDLENWLQAEQLLSQRGNGQASSALAQAGRKLESGSEPRSHQPL